MNLDEDEYIKFLSASYYDCPYYEPDDEYKIVRKQNWSDHTTQSLILRMILCGLFLHIYTSYERIIRI